MSSSALRQVPSEVYQLYRRTAIGKALLENLDNFLEAGVLSPELAYKVLQQFDHCMAKAIAEGRTRKPAPLYRFYAGRLLAYRRLDGLLACVFKDLVVYQMLDPLDVRRFMDEYELERRIMYSSSVATKSSATPKKSKRGPRRSIHPDGTDLVAVKVQTARFAALLTYSPHVSSGRRMDVGSVRYDGFVYDFTSVPANVNPRLEFFTYAERRKEVADKEQQPKVQKPLHAAAAATVPCSSTGAKEFDPRAEAKLMDHLHQAEQGQRNVVKKEKAFKAVSAYWRGNASEAQERKKAKHLQKSRFVAQQVAGGDIKSELPWEAKRKDNVCSVRFSRPTRLSH